MGQLKGKTNIATDNSEMSLIKIIGENRTQILQPEFKGVRLTHK